jgi:hypothetical protein
VAARAPLSPARNWAGVVTALSLMPEAPAEEVYKLAEISEAQIARKAPQSRGGHSRGATRGQTRLRVLDHQAAPRLHTSAYARVLTRGLS